MITHPDYVQKVINEKKCPEHPEKVRYVYPLPTGAEKKSRITKMFPTDQGYTAFELYFDFDPAVPADEDIINAVPQCCSTCLYIEQLECPYFRKHLMATVCPEWKGYPMSTWGEVFYYANLHKAAYEEKFKAAAGVE